MSQKLQEAVAAARAGESETAQRLLADILTKNPDEVQAWFLLSHLVESEPKQLAYLKKVISLDPTHVKAQQRLAYVQGDAALAQAKPKVAPLPISSDPFDFEAQADGDTVPDWMAGDVAAQTAVALPQTDPSPAVEEALDLPDWLQTSLEDDDDGTDKADLIAEVPAATEPAAPAKAKPDQLDSIEAARQAAKVPSATPPPPAAPKTDGNDDLLLYLLIAVAVLIVIAMGYIAFF